jgi:ATP-binding cassette subfamily B protein/subfamily B ATP-binding cassette protein MsbA
MKSTLRQLRLLKYVWPHWRGLITILLTMGLSVALDVARPWPTKLLIDQVLGGRPTPQQLKPVLALLPQSATPQGLLFWVCLSTVLIFLIGTLLSIASGVANVGLGQRITYSLGADLFRHLQRLSLLFHSSRSVGDNISRVTGDAYCVQTLVTSVLLPIVQSVVMLVTMFTIMWRLEPTMTLLALTVTPCLAITIRIFGKPMKTRSRETREIEGRMMSLVQQTLNAIPAVQAFTREEVEHDRFVKYADRAAAAYERSTLAGMWFKLFVGLITSVGTALIMWMGARHVLDGTMTVGTVLVFLSYLSSLYGPINSITYTASTWQSTSANTDRVIEILDIPPDVQDSPNAIERRIEGDVCYENVSFGYEPDKAVLKHVNLKAHPGEVIAIVGPTGAGKTTLVNLLVRFFDPRTGRVTIDGRDIRSISVRSLREQIAIVLQEPFIFPMTVADNIAYGRPDATRDDIIASAVAANADEFINSLREGYDTIVGERGATLSGGEKQRLSIARAFLKDAPILILDEPTSALDAHTESLLLDALDRLTTGRTTFIIAHRLSTIRNADRIIALDHGEIVEQGRHDELMAVGGLYANLYHRQMQVARHDLPTPLPVRQVATA